MLIILSGIIGLIGGSLLILSSSSGIYHGGGVIIHITVAVFSLGMIFDIKRSKFEDWDFAIHFLASAFFSIFVVFLGKVAGLGQTLEYSRPIMARSGEIILRGRVTYSDTNIDGYSLLIFCTLMILHKPIRKLVNKSIRKRDKKLLEEKIINKK